MVEVYKEELREMGFSNSQIDEFAIITSQLAKTTNARERDMLMSQYHELVDGTPYASAASVYY